MAGTFKPLIYCVPPHLRYNIPMDYLLTIVILGIVPAAILILLKPKILSFKTTLIYAALGALLFAIPWDSLIFGHIYELNPKILTGLYLFRLPLEEYLMFVAWTLLAVLSFLFLVEKNG